MIRIEIDTVGRQAGFYHTTATVFNVDTDAEVFGVASSDAPYRLTEQLRWLADQMDDRAHWNFQHDIIDRGEP